ncbi:BTB/POZ domain-containing protein 16-like isoform X2 [Ruditapes philippinarum]|uniref:BTB/POZ domain-containing protein 16-like isoform X2 n=1 Tax=Ruditapes philippinarum TaxID=129788 RepID=UPI00295B08D5|nr:BTB/POZ domain-containing protein 16-like isoform X2 [Ruditapes philippinarum]
MVKSILTCHTKVGSTGKMTEVSQSSLYVQQRVQSSYFPAIPVGAPKATLSYPRATQSAPYTALMGVVVDGRIPKRHPVTSRCRVRKQVGLTNRWRLPESLGSDLLGSSQAIKAVSMPYNQTLMNIITAESAQINMNLDVTKPYTFRQTADRPYTEPPGIPRTIPKDTSQENAAKIPATAPMITSLTKPLSPIKKFMPRSARPVTPKDVFLYHSKRNKSLMGPGSQHRLVGPVSIHHFHDVLLRCLGMDWELHRPFLRKSETLTALLQGADDPRPQLYYKSPASETLDNYIKKSNFYSNEYREMSNRLSTVEGLEIQDVKDLESKKIDHPSLTSEGRVNNVTLIQMDIHDPFVTKTGMAIALGNMYHDEIDVDNERLAEVLAAACILQFKALIKGCTKLMLKNINNQTVCKYHAVASKHQQEHVVLACERWLELNLIPDLSENIQLREMPMELLQKVVKSNRLFVFNEKSVYRTLAYWLFMQLNPHLQLMPSHSTVLSYFNSLPKTTSFIERDDGQIYSPLFSAVRLHGILDTGNIQDMQLMNILPREKLIDLLSQHYHALQGGGDMSLMKNFNTAAIRQGFIMDTEPLYHSEVFSLHGFHFELKGAGSKDGVYSFFMQRLKPGDPILSFRQCERNTFSMRVDREVRYCITAQYVNKEDNKSVCTGIKSQKFGLGEKTSKSEILQMTDVKKPLYVQFALLFPSS